MAAPRLTRTARPSRTTSGSRETWDSAIEATQTALATLGLHRYDLHVYDADWASDRETFSVKVQDTTPPELDVSVSPVCLWPPNHEFQLFKLGRELTYGLRDACDAEPQVKIVSVTSDEPADAQGSGSTGPDVRFGATTACVRAERSGTGSGRSYTVELEARDASGNVSRKSVKVVVPHDGWRPPRVPEGHRPRRALRGVRAVEPTAAGACRTLAPVRGGSRSGVSRDGTPSAPGALPHRP